MVLLFSENLFSRKLKLLFLDYLPGKYMPYEINFYAVYLVATIELF